MSWEFYTDLVIHKTTEFACEPDRRVIRVAPSVILKSRAHAGPTRFRYVNKKKLFLVRQQHESDETRSKGRAQVKLLIVGLLIYSAGVHRAISLISDHFGDAEGRVKTAIRVIKCHSKMLFRHL